MKNVLTPSNLFVTPSSVSDLQDRVESYSGGEKVAATMGMMMTWNLCSKLVQDSIADMGVEMKVISYEEQFDTFHVKCSGSTDKEFAMPAFALAKLDPEQRYLENPYDYVGLTMRV